MLHFLLQFQIDVRKGLEGDLHGHRGEAECGGHLERAADPGLTREDRYERTIGMHRRRHDDRLRMHAHQLNRQRFVRLTLGHADGEISRVAVRVVLLQSLERGLACDELILRARGLLPRGTGARGFLRVRSAAAARSRAVTGAEDHLAQALALDHASFSEQQLAVCRVDGERQRLADDDARLVQRSALGVVAIQLRRSRSARTIPGTPLQ